MGPGDCTVVLQCGCVSKNSCSECQEQKPVCMVKELMEISIFWQHTGLNSGKT